MNADRDVGSDPLADLGELAELHGATIDGATRASLAIVGDPDRADRIVIGAYLATHRAGTCDEQTLALALAKQLRKPARRAGALEALAPLTPRQRIAVAVHAGVGTDVDGPARSTGAARVPTAADGVSSLAGCRDPDTALLLVLDRATRQVSVPTSTRLKVLLIIGVLLLLGGVVIGLL